MILVHCASVFAGLEFSQVLTMNDLYYHIATVEGTGFQFKRHT